MSLQGDDRFIIDRVCGYCGNKMMRAAIYCPSCDRATDGSGKKRKQGKPRDNGAVPFFAGCGVACGLLVLVIVLMVRAFLPSSDAGGSSAGGNKANAASGQAATVANANESERIRQSVAQSEAEALCVERFISETHGLIKNKNYVTDRLGTDEYKVYLHAWTDNDVINVDVECDVKNGNVAYYHSDGLWGPPGPTPKSFR